jgi:hypothetical protein
VEVNPFSLLTVDKSHTFSAGFSIFKPESNVEIAFPIQYSSNTGDDEDDYYDNSHNDLKVFSLDVQFRKFLGTSADGFYLSAFARYAHLRGHLGNDDYYFDFFDEQPQAVPEYGSENKFGLGFGIGYRIFSYSGFYWGVNLSFGRYLIGENNKFNGNLFSIDDDNELFISGEILKFGYAF